MYGDNYRWWVGTVTNNLDPLETGRVQVRIFGVHSDKEEEVSSYDLPWAQCIVPTTEGGTSGIGRMPQLLPGAQVTGFFLDGASSQIPIVIGSIPKIEIANINQNRFAGDPRVEHGFGAGQVYNSNPGNYNNEQTRQFYVAGQQSNTNTSGAWGDEINYPPSMSKGWIRDQVVKQCGPPRYINPRVAVGIVNSEGISCYQSRNTKGDIYRYNGREASFGPFQLYTKPNSTALGTHYQNTVGVDLKKDNTYEGITRQIEFCLDYAIRMKNFNDYFGWVGHPRGSKNDGRIGFNYGGKSRRKKFT